jgi:hypothetical protein
LEYQNNLISKSPSRTNLQQVTSPININQATNGFSAPNNSYIYSQILQTQEPKINQFQLGLEQSPHNRSSPSKSPSRVMVDKNGYPVVVQDHFYNYEVKNLAP